MDLMSFVYMLYFLLNRLSAYANAIDIVEKYLNKGRCILRRRTLLNMGFSNNMGFGDLIIAWDI